MNISIGDIIYYSVVWVFVGVVFVEDRSLHQSDDQQDKTLNNTCHL